MAKKKAQAPWLKVVSYEGTEIQCPTEELQALFAFMLIQSEGYVLKDTRDIKVSDEKLYPYNDPVGKMPLKESSIGSYKDSNIILNPLTLHDRLNQNKERHSTLDYCVSKYLESKDPFYFTLYYLTAGDVLLKNLREAPLDDMAKEWVFEQLEIALQVEADFALDAIDKDEVLTLEVLEDLLVTKYGSKLKGFSSLSNTSSQYGYLSGLGRPMFSYFADKYFEGIDKSNWHKTFEKHKPFDSLEELSR